MKSKYLDRDGIYEADFSEEEIEDRDRTPWPVEEKPKQVDYEPRDSDESSALDHFAMLVDCGDTDSIGGELAYRSYVRRHRGGSHEE